MTKYGLSHSDMIVGFLALVGFIVIVLGKKAVDEDQDQKTKAPPTHKD